MTSLKLNVSSRRALLLLVLAGTLGAPTAPRADFAVFRGTSRIVSLFVLPGETAPFDLGSYAGLPGRALDRFEVTADAVTVVRDPERGYRITAPGTVGIYPVTFQETVDPALSRPAPYHLQVVVLRPAEEAQGGLLNQYPVGVFPGDRVEERWRFQRPRGFVEITEQNRDVLLSDHFSLGEFDCKLEAPYPHYAALQTSLMVKLEGITDELNRRGLPGDHIRVMSGFRTPEYNRSIGNQTVYSRHLAGDAADIFVDRDGDDRMDDLNGDGRINRRDSRFLLALVDAMDHSTDYGTLVGGASAYRANSDHGPFVHVDTRGYPARW